MVGCQGTDCREERKAIMRDTNKKRQPSSSNKINSELEQTSYDIMNTGLLERVCRMQQKCRSFKQAEAKMSFYVFFWSVLARCKLHPSPRVILVALFLFLYLGPFSDFLWLKCLTFHTLTYTSQPISESDDITLRPRLIKKGL